MNPFLPVEIRTGCHPIRCVTLRLRKEGPRSAFINTSELTLNEPCYCCVCADQTGWPSDQLGIGSQNLISKVRHPAVIC